MRKQRRDIGPEPFRLYKDLLNRVRSPARSRRPTSRMPPTGLEAICVARRARRRRGGRAGRDGTACPPHALVAGLGSDAARHPFVARAGQGLIPRLPQARAARMQLSRVRPSAPPSCASSSSRPFEESATSAASVSGFGIRGEYAARQVERDGLRAMSLRRFFIGERGASAASEPGGTGACGSR